MKLFRKRNGSSPPPAEAGPLTAALENQLESQSILAESRKTRPPEPLVVALTAEQKAILARPIDPRVEQLLQELRAVREAAEREADSDRIIQFPKAPPDIDVGLSDAL
jgi:hypothetical protein